MDSPLLYRSGTGAHAASADCMTGPGNQEICHTMLHLLPATSNANFALLLAFPESDSTLPVQLPKLLLLPVVLSLTQLLGLPPFSNCLARGCPAGVACRLSTLTNRLLERTKAIVQ